MPTMTPSIRSRARAWFARWRRPARPLAAAPYRAASPPAPPRPSPRPDTRTALGRVWPLHRMVALGRAVGVSVFAVVLFATLVRCARFAAPHVSPSVAHLLAIPFGLLVGLVAAIAFLAAGWVLLCVAALSLVSAWHVLVGLARGVVALTTGRSPD